MEKFFAWLTQQSTIKAIIVLAGVVGIQIEPDYFSEILAAVGVLYSGVAAFLDRN